MLYVLIFVSFVCVQTVAGEELTLSQETLTSAIEQATELQKKASKLLNGKQAKNSFIHDFLESQPSLKNCPFQGLTGNADRVKRCIKNTTPLIPKSETPSEGPTLQENADRILVFVSFSMPEASLKSLMQEAPKHHAVLVMRGLYQDSFIKTASKLQELGIAVDIHPELFETHQVTSVPTFVRLEDGQPIHCLKGNVTLDFVMKTFEEQRVKEVP